MSRPTATTMRWCLLPAIVTFAIAMNGCSSPQQELAPPTASVSGTIAVAGKSMREGTIHLYSFTTGEIGVGPIDKKGEFKLDTPLASGDYTVYLSNVSGVPEKFYSETSSGQQVTLIDGDNNLTIDLN
ncbi:hypothetical protein Poly24_46640 [Rosistilla carotiformis]|uniref:Carboxypeptidase regulatory-like domain-containing protein n=1 Tax=Rosistilla carotiformis TaxID=2528017 RepID=A0A518JZF9_9BACT|nr:hypothetical protein [Rosistilla carotiformis]QDV70931.1 hypothetical protein Poly24_46640 [Rosistilla carotiformis]